MGKQGGVCGAVGERAWKQGAPALLVAALGAVLAAPAMVYNRSKSSDLQFAPFTDAAGTVHANSFNGFESSFETDADPSVRRGAWASFSAGLKAYNQT